VRSQFYRFKGAEYVLCARTLGASDGRIIFRHILPNAIGTIITSAVLLIPGVIFSEAMLSYLGIVNLEAENMTSIGTMLAGGRQYLSTYPHILAFPAIFIALLEISFHLFGNGLRDAFNPVLRGTEE
jgi:oligopeptide transport system permease protein